MFNPPFPLSEVGFAMGGLLMKVGGADKTAPCGGGRIMPGGGPGGRTMPGLTGGSDIGCCIRGLGPLAICAIILGGNPGGGPGGIIPGIPGGGPGGLPGGGPGGNILGGGALI